MQRPWGQREIGVFEEQRRPMWLKWARRRGQEIRLEGDGGQNVDLRSLKCLGHILVRRSVGDQCAELRKDIRASFCRDRPETQGK